MALSVVEKLTKRASFRNYSAYIITLPTPDSKAPRHRYRFVNNLIFYDVSLETSPPEGGLVCGGKRRFKVLGTLRLFNFVGLSVHLDDVVVLVLPAHRNRAHPNMFVTAVLIRQNRPVGREPVGQTFQKVAALGEGERHGRLRRQTPPAPPPPLRGRPLQPTAVSRKSLFKIF